MTDDNTLNIPEGDLAELRNPTPFEAWCLGTAIITYLSLSDPEAATTITSMADHIHRVLSGDVDAPAD